MRGRRLAKTGGVFAGIGTHCNPGVMGPGFFRAENDADGCRSFAAVERSMSDRLLLQLDDRHTVSAFRLMTGTEARHVW
jgi:hypothetical protein